MSTLDQDARLNRRLAHDRPGRQFSASDDAAWGELIEPAPAETSDKRDIGMRILLFSSMAMGLRAVQTITAYERRYPDRVNLVGLITDDPANDAAKISLKRRLWQYLDVEQRFQMETATIEMALQQGTPVYTGEIKVDSLRQWAGERRPDVILVCGLGQVMDRALIDLPPYGSYNFHPADLAHHHGAGAAPFGDIAERDADTTVWTVHQVTEVVDAGPVIGQSPPVNIRDDEGAIPDTLSMFDKMLYPLGAMIYILVETLCDRFEHRQTGKLDHLDFARRFPDDVKARMLASVTPGRNPLTPITEAMPAVFDLD